MQVNLVVSADAARLSYRTADASIRPPALGSQAEGGADELLEET